MKTITLLQIQNEAKKLQDTQNVTYNQCLQIIAQQNGYKSYQAILNQIKKDYIDDENEEIKEFKLNIFENRKHIKSNFIKIKKLAEKYKEIEVSEELDDDEEKRKELLEEIEETAAKVSNSIAKIFFKNILHKGTDNGYIFVEGCAYAGYTTSGYETMYNDIDAYQADYVLELNIEKQSFGLFYRDFRIVDDSDDENFIEYKEWNDWNETSDIELP